ncbi:MAG: beta-lactamase family protein [Firmicutes bacterium]|jgi:CubicO group peptidase (beta-lactamase class C family)|nr:beta-lactamase family protein [Bacillota bacterium]
MTHAWQDYARYVEEVMERDHIAGAAISVSQNGKILFQQGFGYRHLAKQQPVTPDTIFGIASVSKSFTAVAIMQLVDAGLLSVDDPVVKYLPEFQLHGVEDINSVKIKHLLSHTTGMPPMRRRQDITTFEEHLEFLAQQEYELLGQPGEYLSYCNDTFLLLGAIIERLTGRIYRKYMTSNILDALEMYRSTYSIEELTRFKDVTVPYIYNKQTGEFEERPWPALGNFEVGGGVRSCVTDLMKYGEIFVNGGKRGDRVIVSRQGLEHMQTPVYQYGRKTWYGFGLTVTYDHAGNTLVEHGGSQPGVASNFGFVPEQGLVVAVLTNTSGAPAKSLWLAAVNTALGLPLDLPRSVEPEYEASQADKERIVGTYRSAEGGRLRVFVEDGQLYVETAGEQYPARMSSPATAVFTTNVERVIKFFFREEEPAWAVFSGLRMLQRAAE